jgi:hypothetical protein
MTGSCDATMAPGLRRVDDWSTRLLKKAQIPVIPGPERSEGPETHEHRLENQELGLCSWVPGSALKGRPGMTAEFFGTLSFVLEF